MGNVRKLPVVLVSWFLPYLTQAGNWLEQRAAVLGLVVLLVGSLFLFLLSSTVGAVVLGGTITIAIAIMVESFRKPDLTIEVPEPEDLRYSSSYPAGRGWFVGLDLRNRPLPWYARWMARSPAILCHGYINFYRSDGLPLFERSMNFRWAASPEPVAIRGYSGRPGRRRLADRRQIILQDPSRFAMEQTIDVSPGDVKRFGVVARFDQDAECYGWCNENYHSTPPWRNPAWRMPRRLYLLEVVVASLGEESREVFRLENGPTIEECRLLEATQQDRENIRAAAKKLRE